MRILILSHATELAGPVDAYESFLLGEHPEATVLKLSHPLDAYEGRSSILTERGVERWRRSRHGRMAANLMLDCVLNLWMIWRLRPDVVVGANNFDLATAAILRPLRRPVAIYFAADYSGQRFTSAFLNRVYLALERFCLRNARVVVSNTRRAARKRQELGLRPERSLVVPNGLLLDEPLFPKKVIHPDHFIYVGNVTREHGLREMVELLGPAIRQLVVIGSGDDLSAVRATAERLGVPHTFLPPTTRDRVLTHLQHFPGWGLAPYNRTAEWTYFCSPMKVNEYIACGLPVVVSDVPEIAEVVAAKGLGITYDMIAPPLLEAIKRFSTEGFEQKAEAFYQEYRYDRLYQSIPLD